MKRSTQIGLAAAGVVMVATVWSLSGDDPKEDLVFNSIEDCRSNGALGAQACETAYAIASDKRLREAPRYADNAACEAVYGPGSCSAATIDGRTHILPALAGFMLARNLAGRGYQPAAPLLPPTLAACPPAARRAGSGRPECEPPSSAAAATTATRYGSSGGGLRWRSYSTTSGGSIAASPTVSRRATQTATSRGGFGSTSRSYSSRISS
jgi:uncharacterized protein YgiB involved in biofilm formation